MGAVESWPHVFHPGTANAPLCVTLHGTGADEHDPIGLGHALMPGSPILSPRGKVSENGMNRWFRRLSEGVFDIDDVIVRAGELAAFITDAKAHYDITGPVVAIGFSNGANIASATALLHPTVIQTVVGFSGMYPFGDRDPIGDVSGVSLFMANGSTDFMAPIDSVHRLESIASKHGASVTSFVRPGGHGITQEDVTEASQWLRDRGF